MTGGLRVDVEYTDAVAVLRPRGDLDSYSASDLRSALLDCLADQPAGIVVDASALLVLDDVALTVLAGAAQQNERWPGSRLTLAGATVALLTAADRMGVLRHITNCPDEDAARVELGKWPVPVRTMLRIAPDRDAPGVARTAVQQFCRENQVGGSGDGDAAQLVASELVTNAVVHAGTPIDLTLRLAESMLHIAVRDGDAGKAHLAGIMDESTENGRGLLLVDALAVTWGNFVPSAGKVVWATVRVRPTVARREATA